MWLSRLAPFSLLFIEQCALSKHCNVSGGIVMKAPLTLITRSPLIYNLSTYSGFLASQKDLS